MQSNSGLQDHNTLKRFYYKNDSKLKIRIDTWDQFGSSSEKYSDWLVRQIGSTLQEKNIKNGKLLDIGCGTGEILSKVITNANLSEAYGVDISEGMINDCRDSVQREKTKHSTKCQLQFKVGDVTKIDFCDARFNIVLCSCVLHHTTELHKALKEIARVCAKDGMIFIATSDFHVDKGINALHYQALSELMFPNFMTNTATYTRFTLSKADSIITQQYENHFQKVYYKNDLIFDSPEPIIKYYKTAMMYRGSLGSNDTRISSSMWSELENKIAAQLDIHFKKHQQFVHPGGISLYIIQKQ